MYQVNDIVKFKNIPYRVYFSDGNKRIIYDNFDDCKYLFTYNFKIIRVSKALNAYILRFRNTCGLYEHRTDKIPKEEFKQIVNKIGCVWFPHIMLEQIQNISCINDWKEYIRGIK